MHGMKSHNCHVFMQKLIPVAFREMLPEHAWSALTEVSLLFQSIYSTTLDVHKLHELENTVAIILCNLEKIFPPGFFDLMEHLIVHLPYEARASGAPKKRWLTRPERHIIEMYILTNYEVVTPYYESYLNELYQHHHSGDPIIDQLVSTGFKD
ncbi:UNVERIFIED_CONTAM: hypothetical protein Slati_2421000 [Sesamum latifolium]|uniref:DUF4218 domain-containing protein n=1 Tax=Sesamum latifolium TaxID=2727402 RepID=A0AAW2WGS1_9LAMI